MSGGTEHVTDADCVLCRDLDPDQRRAMRADLLEVPLPVDNICDGCMEAFTAKFFASFPKTEEERMRRREEMARRRDDLDNDGRRAERREPCASLRPLNARSRSPL